MNLLEHFEEKGYQRGFEEGRQEMRKAIAKLLFNLGVSHKTIAEVTKVDIESLIAEESAY